MEKMLKDQIAIVAGATSGMGEAVARLYAQEGAAVIIGGRSEKKGKRIAEEITAAGGVARYYGSMDISRKEDIDAMVDQTLAEYGRHLQPGIQGDSPHEGAQKRQGNPLLLQRSF